MPTLETVEKKIKRWKTANKSLDRLIRIISLVIILLATYTAYDTLYMFSHTNQNIAYFFEGDKEEWDKLPDNAVAWLRIDKTTIDHPVMQGKTNEEYLNKDPFGQYSVGGSIYLDSWNDPEWGDEYNLLYGHHMAAKQMFGALDDFEDKKFFDSHKTGIIKTRGADYSLDIFAVIEVESTERLIFNVSDNKSDSAKLLDHLARDAIYYETPKTEKIVAMSTCKDIGSTRRLVVLASMTVIREPGTLYDKDNLVEPNP